MEKNRCKWCNMHNSLYIKYHDEEWCQPQFDDKYLLEMLILESFQAGLSWECVLNKREDFRKTYDNFDIDKICEFDENKINELISNEKIIRNKLKIKASINNAKVFKNVPLTIPCKEQVILRGEAVIRYSDFERINEEIESMYAVIGNIVIFSSRELHPGEIW